jgi:hypothetical protein
MSRMGGISVPAPLNPFVAGAGSVDFRVPWTALTVGTASRLHAAAFHVNRPVTVSTAWFHVSTQAGNMDVGILQGADFASVTRIASAGSTATPAAGLRSLPLTAAVTLVPGQIYWAAISMDTLSGGFYAVSPGVSSLINEKVKAGFVRTGTNVPIPAGPFALESGGTAIPFFVYFV